MAMTLKPAQRSRQRCNMRGTLRPATPWRAAAAISLAVLAAGAAQAAVTPLYSEYGPGGSGDLAGHGSSAPMFLLGSGLSTVSGILSASRSSVDTDAVRFVLGSGLELVGVSVSYSFDATVGGGWAATVEHGLHRDVSDLQYSSDIFESISLNPPGSGGSQNLFDGSGSFSPLDGATTRELYLSFANFSGSSLTTVNYRYTLVFDVQQPAATDVPEPGSLSLAGLALASAAAVSCGHRRRGQVQAGPTTAGC